MAMHGAVQRAEMTEGTIAGMIGETRGEGIEETMGALTIAAMTAIGTGVAGISDCRSPYAALGRPSILFRYSGSLPEGVARMNVTLSFGPLMALIAGILILVVPRLLNYIVAIYLILIGLVGLFGSGHLRL
jgi:hypothetical protein